MAAKRVRTINGRGEVVERPYGVGRWHSPRTRSCAHEDCDNAASVLRPADENHGVTRAHNCCTQH